jgi:cytochrome c-type biogenesis protein
MALSTVPNPTLNQRWRVFKAAALFVLGFTSSFVAIGLALHSFAAIFVPYRMWVERFVGVLFIVAGIFLLSSATGSWFQTWYKEFRWQPPDWLKKHDSIYALLTGVAFGSSWTPCIGPVLAVILFWSARQATEWQGIALLITYGMGMGLPFLLVGGLFDVIVPWLKRSSRLVKYATLLSAIIVMWSGARMLLGFYS